MTQFVDDHVPTQTFSVGNTQHLAMRPDACQIRSKLSGQRSRRPACRSCSSGFEPANARGFRNKHIQIMLEIEGLLLAADRRRRHEA